MGLAVGSGVPATAGGAIPRETVPVVAAEPVPGATDVAASRGGLEPARLALDDRRATAPSTPTTDIRDTGGPSAAMQPLTVEHGELIVRWRDSDGLGPGIARRTLRIEQAAATPTGCAAFIVVGGLALAGGPSDQGTVSLGQPPSTGCLRVSLALTDGAGRTSMASSLPYRVQPPAVAKAKPTVPQWSGRYNLFRANAFVTQKTFKWCVAASVQMMVNLVRDRTDRSRKTQARMIAYAQRWDNGPYGEEGGTDVTGWIAALRHYGAGNYRAVGATTAARALRVAATAMAQTGRPAGILVMDGRHAWVLHGFESKTDPRRDRRAQITAVRISGPLYPLQQKNGYDPRPNTRLSVRKLERYFLPTSVGTMIGRYVVVIPTH
jgi:hypothetical protein